MAHDVFLSYSSKDKPIADAVCGTLEGERIRCWIAPRDVLPGLPWGEAIVEAIEASRVMILLFSSSSNNSPQVMREVERAVSKGIPIIPLRIEQVSPSKSLEYFISAPHWLDALTPPLEKHLQSLAGTVHLLLSRHGERHESLATESGASPRTGEEDDAPHARKTKAAHPKRSRKWLGVPLAIVLVLSGLLGIIIWFAQRNHLPPADDNAPTASKSNGQKSVPYVAPSITNATKIGDTIEVPLTKAVRMKFAWVPPGKSWLGGGGGKPGTQEFTLPKGLWCGVYPVTQAEWQAVMGNNPSHFTGNPRNPVEQVSWDDAQAFLQKLNSRLADSGLTYRLPSAEEWEYICRGGPLSQAQSEYHFYFARSKSDLTSVPTNDLSSRQANFDGNYPAGSASKGPYLQATSEVGLYLPNPLGIYDLHGNVWEWTSTPKGSSRVFRGGCWRNNARYCTASLWGWVEPGNRSNGMGFRVLAVPSGAK